MFLTAQGGILGPFAWLLGKLMNLIYNLLANSNGIANLGVCIIIFTIVVKLILLPFTLKQQKSAKINMFLQPEMKKIQKKYNGKKDEKSMLQQQKEMKELYNKYGTSMTGGCLTSFIQLPIIYALYRVIQNVPAYVGKVYKLYEPIATSVSEAKGDKVQQFLIDFVNDSNISSARYAISKFEKVAEVSTNNIIDVLSNFGITNLHDLLDKLSISDAAINGNVDKIDQIHSFMFGINISEAPGWHIGLPLLIPVLTALFQWLSMKVTSNPSAQLDANGNDPSASMMKTMSVTMPIMSLFVTVSLPAAIGIYWMMSALITVVIQLGINAYYNHIDVDALLEKQMEIAKVKNAKKGNKKSFYERLMDQSAQMQEELEKQEAMRNNSAKSLKNYVPVDNNKESETRSNKTYKAGSLGAKANIMMNYNVSDNKKEEK
ncbi:MAG: YidC/Oxa1 family membrane protein insertase [Eubacteriales bacterium]|nr:YidC/Oxa1 family membrane protein insertase [Eubacteriales bacterium]